MAVPWLQIVHLVPSIVDVSRELLKRSKAPAPAPETSQSGDPLTARMMALEENERRQAELISRMADQIAVLSKAVTVLHRRVIWLSAGLAAALVAAAIGIWM